MCAIAASCLVKVNYLSSKKNANLNILYTLNLLKRARVLGGKAGFTTYRVRYMLTTHNLHFASYLIRVCTIDKLNQSIPTRIEIIPPFFIHCQAKLSKLK